MSINFYTNIFFKNQNFNVSPEESNPNTYSSNVLNNTSFVIKDAEYETNQITENTKKRALTEFKTMQLSKKQTLQHHAFSKIEINISDSELFSPEDATFLDSLDELPRVDKNLSRDDTIEAETTDSSFNNTLSAEYETNQITENTKKRALTEFKTMQLSKKQTLQHEDILSYKHNYFFKYIRKHERNYKKVVLNAVSKNGLALKYASHNLKNDKEIVLAAVGKNGLALKYASHNLKGDKEVVLAAVRANGYALEYVSDNLKGNKEAALIAVCKNGSALKYASDNLKGDKQVVLAAVNQIGGALQYANENLRSDKEVVLAAVNQTGGALQYANENLRSDKEAILTAVSKSAYCFIYTSKSLKFNKEFVLEALNQNGRVLPYLCKAFRDDEEAVLTAVRKAPHCLKYASARLQSNPECLSLVTLNDQITPNFMTLQKYIE